MDMINITLAQLTDIDEQVEKQEKILTIGNFAYLWPCPMQNWYAVLNANTADIPTLSTPIQYARWFSTQSYYGIIPLKEQHLTYHDHVKFNPFWQEKQQLILQLKQKYPDYPIQYVIPGPLTYLWFNRYLLADSRQFTPEKIAYLPILIQQYKLFLQEFKKLGIAWVQLEDPIFITDILPEYQKNIISAYQDLLCDAPNVLLATYFGGIEENIHWMNNIPIQGLHIDLAHGPEQIMFVLRNEIIKSLKNLSIGGITPQDSQFAAIQNYIDNLPSPKPDLSFKLTDKSNNADNNVKNSSVKRINNNIDNNIDIIKLYLDSNWEDSSLENHPKILLLHDKLQQLKKQNSNIQFSTESFSDITCFLKKRDQENLLKNINIIINKL